MDGFSDHVLTTAILDRRLHHATALNIKGESYRLKDKRRVGVLGRESAFSPPSAMVPEHHEDESPVLTE